MEWGDLQSDGGVLLVQTLNVFTLMRLRWVESCFFFTVVAAGGSVVVHLLHCVGLEKLPWVEPFIGSYIAIPI